MNTKSIRLSQSARHVLADSGAFNATSDISRAALAAIDPERVSSAVGVVAEFSRTVEQINRDRDLSEHGKRDRIKAAASARLSNIARTAREVAALERKHAEARRTAVKLEKPDAAETLIDLALAQHVRAAEPIPSALVAMSERLRVAVARLPVELSGITVETQARVVGSLVSPTLAAQFAEESEVLEAARTVVQGTIDDVAPLAGWGAGELVEAFGDAWKLPGLTASHATRLSAEQASETAAEAA